MERWKILACLVSFTFFMENLDATVIATALPQMAATFGRDAVDLNLGISAYLLAIAVGIPVSGWIAERFGPRPVFTLAIGLFTLASLLCGLAQSLEQFIAARVLQGLGGALMVPVGRLVVLQVTEKHELVRAIALITWPGLVAPVLGPPLGGLITTYADWRWIFYLNLPLGLIALVLAWRLVPTTLPTRRHPLDWQGFLLLGGACVAFMWGVERLGQNHGSLGSNLAWMGVGLILGTKAVRHMARIERPLIDFGTLRIPTYRASILGGGLFRVTIATRALPAALDVPARLRSGCLPGRATAPGAVRRQPGGQALHHRRHAPLRAAPHPHRQRPAQRPEPAGLRAAHSRLAIAAGGDPAVRQRPVPLAAIHRQQYSGFRRRPQDAAEPCLHPVQYQFPVGHGLGRGRRRPAATGVDGVAWAPRSTVVRLSASLLHSGRARHPEHPGCLPPGPQRRRFGQRSHRQKLTDRTVL
ncbi:MFS family permease [Pseudomonas psychrotolerans]|nr:MFS family permease [Pseudomonas psychrotolerans]